MTGSALLLLVFLALYVYAIIESTAKWKTALQILAVMVAFVAIVWVASGFGKSAAIGTLAGVMLAPLGIAACIIDIRREKKKKLSLAAEGEKV